MRKIKALDAVFILCFVIAIAVSIFIMIKGGGGAAPRVFIETPGAQFVYSLDSQDTYSFRGLLGDTKVEIADGAARVVSSPCPNKTCVQQGAISRPGQWIACLPNGVIVYIENTDYDSAVDGSTF